MANTADSQDPDSRSVGGMPPDDLRPNDDELDELLSLIRVPETIGKYKVKKELGRGGYGKVYLAHDPDLRRDVAIKVSCLPTHVDQAALIEEARRLGHLGHKGIVSVFEGFEFENQYAVVMEYAGRSLHELLTLPSPPPLEELTRFLVQIADALHYAHEEGYIHRDVKPGNILIGMNRRERTVKIGDFGLSTSSASQSGLDSMHGGTLQYASPEQLESPKSIDRRTDIWSIGIILYEILTGRLPFTGTDKEIRRAILHENPVPPSRLRAGVPKDLETICLKCLEKDRRRRFATAQQLAHALTMSACRYSLDSVEKLGRISFYQKLAFVFQLAGLALALSAAFMSKLWFG